MRMRTSKGTMATKIISVNTGPPREGQWHGISMSTGIYKEPVEGRVAVRKLNLDGDRQADLTVHGGPQEAVYCYPGEHYSYWKQELPGQGVADGNFGENFTTEGLLEDSVHLGDRRFAASSAVFVVMQPRLPCYKLGIRFQDDGMASGSCQRPDRFLLLGRLEKGRSAPAMRLR